MNKKDIVLIIVMAVIFFGLGVMLGYITWGIKTEVTYTTQALNDSIQKYNDKITELDSLLLNSFQKVDSIDTEIKIKDSLLVLTYKDYNLIKESYEGIFFTNADVLGADSLITEELSKNDTL